MEKKTLMHECAAELIGTYLLVFFGTGSVWIAVLVGGLNGLWQVGMVWAIGIALAIYATGAVSGTHINPAITLALTVFRGFPKRKVLPYVLAQLLGAFAAAATLFALYHTIQADFEVANGLVRGEPGSQLSAMVFGGYFPNPAVYGTSAEAFAKVSHLQAMLSEGIGTALLAFFVFLLIDSRNTARPNASWIPFMIGTGVAIIICITAPLTQTCINPARDFAPRLFAYLAGWGKMAIPGPRDGFFIVYILSPLIGAVVGAGIYDFAIRPAFLTEEEAAREAALSGTAELAVD
jgi:glycerol uptake facilitator protein